MVSDRPEESEELAEASRALLAQARAKAPRASPFLATRVLAEVAERRRRNRMLRFWQGAALLATSAGLALALWTRAPQGLQAPVGVAVVVRVEPQDLKSVEVAYAQIDLPEGVSFYSEKHPAIVAKRELVLPWKPGAKGSYLPFAIRASSPGVRKLTVRFLGSDGKLVSERTLNIRFGTPG